MSIELLGFVAGISVVLGAALVLVSHEQWKAIRSAYGREMPPPTGRKCLDLAQPLIYPRTS